jgi:hypothetical protein
MRLFHGGLPGLVPGDRLLPASESGALTKQLWFEQARRLGHTTGDLSLDRWMDNVPYDAGYLYLTVDEIDARQFAAAYVEFTLNEPAVARPGDAYEVAPDVPWEPDPDSIMPGQWWRARGATVVRVVARRCVHSKESLRQAAQIERERLRRLGVIQ